MGSRPDTATGITRRVALRRAGSGAVLLTGLPTLLAACGDDEETGAAATSTGPPKAKGVIDYLGVEGEDGKGVRSLERYLSRSGARLQSTYTAAPAETLQRFKSGRADGVDLVDFSNAQVAQFHAADVMQEIDPERVPNLKNLSADYRGTDKPWYVDGKLYAIPYYNGPFTPVWDTRAVSKPITSWDQYREPSLKGRLGFYSSPEGTLNIAAIATGAAKDPTRPGEVPKAKLGDVSRWLEDVVPNVRSFAPSLGDLVNQFKAREIDAAFGGWAGFAGIAALAGVNTISYTALPSPGAPAAVEVWSVGRDADNADSVLAYMNQVLDPRANGELNLFLAGGPSVDGAYEAVPDLEKVLPKDAYAGKLGTAELPYLQLPPAESDEFITSEEWTAKFTELIGA